MPNTPRSTAKKPTAPRTRTRSAAVAPAAFTADDEKAAPALSEDVASTVRATKFSQDDTSIEAVEARQDANAKAQGYEGARYDPITSQRVVVIPNGRGQHRKTLRDVRPKTEAQTTGVGDYYEPGAGWVRNGSKKESDFDATRDDNVYEE